MTAQPAVFRLSDRDLRMLAAGAGDAATIGVLRAGQLSRHLLLLRAVDGTAARRFPAAHAAARFADAYSLLARVQEAAPDVVAEALSCPDVGGWLGWCCRRLHAAGPDSGPAGDLESGLAHLAGVACAAALRAGMPFELAAAAPSGQLALPGLGVLAVPGTQVLVRGSGAAADAWSEGKHLRIQPGAAAPGWRPARRLTAVAGGCQLSVVLDDLDPYRCAGMPGGTQKVDGAELAIWQDLLTGAWELLAREHRGRAEAIAAGLRALVPQPAPEPGRSISSTSAEAFGAIALSRPADPAAFAVTLVHEFQHGKLSALLDMLPLHAGTPDARYYAPWRDDPRPLGGLLQGTYAFLGVTDFWRVHRGRAATAQAREHAEFEFARWREQTSRACAELAAAPELTPAGRRFVTGMTATLQGWRGEQVAPDLAARAADSAAEHRAQWRIRNLRPDPAAVHAATAAWLAGQSAPACHAGPAVAGGAPPSHTDTARLRLRHLRVSDPTGFAAVRADPAALVRAVPGATAADVSYAAGDYAAATSDYRTLLRQDPAAAAWAGLALALRGEGRQAAAAALLAEPELTLAVYQALRDLGVTAEAEVLARWMTPTSPDREEART